MQLRNLIVVSALVAGGCSQKPAPPAPQAKLAAIDAKGLHNVYRLTDKLYSGSSPDGDEGFASLEKLGIKTIISVDGAKPDVDAARKHGLCYVHLPIGYDGVPEQQALRIARAARDLPGPVYIHCHHGKHRGPAAAATAMLFLDEHCSAASAVEVMRTAGTDPHYTGLYAAPERLARPTRAELDQVEADFPEVARIPGLAQAMVEIDMRWDRLKEARRAGWKVPPKHPDVEPAHEALQLTEQYREAGRLPETRDRPEELQRWLVEAEEHAQALDRALKSRVVDSQAVDAAFARVATDCSQCHAKYRDVPR
jgi:protein tyrosine phosphatase (PTP) superfamily phosphohydrolase (DUF442 family)